MQQCAGDGPQQTGGRRRGLGPVARPDARAYPEMRRLLFRVRRVRTSSRCRFAGFGARLCLRRRRFGWRELQRCPRQDAADEGLIGFRRPWLDRLQEMFLRSHVPVPLVAGARF